jgi:LCP family protein required for cell wall assembly
MVAAYDGVARRGYIVGIPRDTLVDVQRNNRKIVAAYPSGRGGGRGHEGGVERLKQEVQTLIGFRPDFYVSVDFDAFVRLVDAVNGVEVNVPFHMRYDDPYQNLSINIPAGIQTLNGRQALHFVRFRLANDRSMTISDYQRIENQQQVMHALFRELLSPRTILLVPELIRTYRDHVSTDLSLGEQAWFAEQLSGVSGPAALTTYTLPTTGTSGSPNWFELADRDAILELVNRTINPFVQDITANMLRIISQ